MEKTFRCSPGIPGYGPRIFINRDVEIQNEIRAKLNQLSVFGGSTSSSPTEYYMWEFPDDAIAFKKAYVMLWAANWNEQKPIRSL